MKKTLIFISCILLGVASCKKDSADPPSHTITATINGVEENFNTGAYAQLTTGVATNSNLAIFGTNGSGTSADVMSLTLMGDQTLYTATYSSGNSGVASASILYSNGVATSGVLSNGYATPASGNPSTITITSLTSTSVQGTFSGVLVLLDGSTTKAVTNGQFSLALK
jgi:hypothetical protein